MDLLSDGSIESASEDEKEDCIDKAPPIKRQKRAGRVEVISSDRIPAGLFQRSVPHKRGDWSGHVHIPIPSECISDAQVERSSCIFRRQLEAQGYFGTIVKHPRLHVSLSKYFSLRLPFIESFVNKLKARLSLESPTRLYVDRRPFTLVNDEKTRSFLCFRLQSNSNILRVLKQVDSVLAAYNQPAYYNPPIFHVSVASFNGNLGDLKLENIGHCGESSSSDSDSEGSCSPFLEIDRIFCEFGTTKSYSIPLGLSR